MFQLSIAGDTIANLRANVAEALAVLDGGADAAADEAQPAPAKPAKSLASKVKEAVGSTASVSAPKKGKPAAAPEPDGDDDADAGEDVDPLDEDDGDEEVTREMVKEKLIEVKKKFAKDPNAVGKLVAVYDAKMLKDVPEENLADLYKDAVKRLAQSK